jgi:hypothetical protein
MERRPVLILMDVDGVLNPVRKWDSIEQEHLVLLPNDRRVLLAEASTLGTIVWGTSCSLSVTEQLERQAGIAGTTLRMPLGSGDPAAETPKLRQLSRWVTRFIAESPADVAMVVWIDDVHGRDAHELAASSRFPLLLVTTQPQHGLTTADLDKARRWIGRPEQAEHPPSSK